MGSLESAAFVGANRRRCADGRCRSPARAAMVLPYPLVTIAKTARYVVLAGATLGVLA